MPHYERTYPVPDRVDLCARDRALAILRYFYGFEPEEAEKDSDYARLVAVIEAAECHGRQAALGDLEDHNGISEEQDGLDRAERILRETDSEPPSVFEELPPRRVEIDEETAKILAMALRSGCKPEGDGA